MPRDANREPAKAVLVKVEEAREAGNQIFLESSGREEIKDRFFGKDVSRIELKNRLFIRVGANKKNFVGVDFTYTYFDSCYFRDCVFDSCKFIGCRFLSCNLHGTRFIGCTMDYATFERTLVDESIVAEGGPGHDNLRMRFARSLRINYQQIGDGKAANRAAMVELDATRSYLYRAWASYESYYRKKYTGFRRVEMFLSWMIFKILDYVWGNGESIWKLCRTVFCLLILIAFTSWYMAGANSSLWMAALDAPVIFFGVATPAHLPPLIVTLIVVLRLVTFGFFMSVIIKKFNRR